MTVRVRPVSSLLLPIAAAWACGGDGPGQPPAPPAEVQVIAARALERPGMASYPATTTAARTAHVATRMAGTVVDVRVDVGSRVTAGEPVVLLDDADLRARLGAVRAGEALARTTHERIARLADDGAASRQELDEAAAALASAVAAVRDAEAQLGYAVVRAPFAGYVTARLVDPGDLATPGRPLLEVQSDGALVAEALLPAGVAGDLRPGDPVEVVVPSSGAAHGARVLRVTPAVEPGSQRFRLEAELEPGPPLGLLPGSFVHLRWPEAASPTVWIPEDAVVRRGQLTGVFSVEDDTLRLRWLRLGETRDGAVEVLAGPPGPLLVARRPDPGWVDATPVSSLVVRGWPDAAAGDAP
jgi:membrane fusion protein (multidrug efflux system)